MSRIRMFGAAVVAAGCVAGAVVGLAAQSAGATSARCGAVSLVPTFKGNRGTAGHFNDIWWLTNMGGSACTISGYPIIVNYRQDGRPLHATVAHRGTPHTVTVRPHEHAITVLSYVDPRVSGCTPEPVAGMTMGWSGTTYPLITPRGVKSCDGALSATPFVHGG